MLETNVKELIELKNYSRKPVNFPYKMIMTELVGEDYITVGELVEIFQNFKLVSEKEEQ